MGSRLLTREAAGRTTLFPQWPLVLPPAAEKRCEVSWAMHRMTPYMTCADGRLPLRWMGAGRTAQSFTAPDDNDWVLEIGAGAPTGTVTAGAEACPHTGRHLRVVPPAGAFGRAAAGFTVNGAFVRTVTWQERKGRSPAFVIAPDR